MRKYKEEKKQYGNGKVDIFTPCFIKLDEVSLSEQLVILCIFLILLLISREIEETLVYMLKSI